MHEVLKRLISNNFLIKTIKHGKYEIAKFNSKASVLNSSDNIPDRIILSKQDEEFKVGRKLAQKKLTEILDIKAIKALEIVTTYKMFCETPFLLMSANYEICIINNLGKNVVLKYPYILIENNLSHKIEKLQTLSVKLSYSIPMVKLSLMRLNKISLRNIETTARIYDLCRIFGITTRESCEILATKPFLLGLNLNHLEDNFKLLVENGICKENLVRDMWVFKYSDSFIRNRLQCIKEHRVESVKTWMVHCPEETLYKHIKRESDDRDILGENSVAEYLSERLKCSESIAKYLIKRQPALQTKSLLKMNEMIDFLYQQGFTPRQICKVPKVLLHSTKTAKNRLKELSALGKKPDSLYILIKSQKQYLQHIETLLKPKMKQAL